MDTVQEDGETSICDDVLRGHMALGLYVVVTSNVNRQVLRCFGHIVGKDVTLRGVPTPHFLERGDGPPSHFATTWFQNITSPKHDVCQLSIVKACKIALW